MGSRAMTTELVEVEEGPTDGQIIFKKDEKIFNVEKGVVAERAEIDTEAVEREQPAAADERDAVGSGDPSVVPQNYLDAWALLKGHTITNSVKSKNHVRIFN